MTATETKPAVTVDQAYELLLKGMAQDKTGMAATKVNALVKSRHAVTLAEYHKLPGSDLDKVAFYRECVRIVVAAVKEQAAKPAAAELFAKLVPMIKAADGKFTPPAHIQIAAHLRAVTGRTMNLGVYNVSTDFSEADKAKLYSEVIAALEAGDLSTLKGEVGKGDKRAEPAAEPKAEAPQPAAEPVAETPEADAETGDEAPSEADEAIRAAMKALEEAKAAKAAIEAKRRQAEAAKASVDEASIRRIIAQAVPSKEDIESIVSHHLGNGGFPVSRVESIVEDRLKRGASLDVDKVVAPRVDALLDAKLSDFLKRGPTALSSSKPTAVEEGKLASYVPAVDPAYVVSAEQREFLKHVHTISRGKVVNVIATGPAGCGKTTLAEVLGAEFKMPVLVMDCANIREPRDWFGFKYTEGGDVKWHRSQFDRCLSAGNHVIVLDELPRTTDQIRNVIFPLLDYRRRTWLEERGDYITVGPGTIIWSTANIGFEFTGSTALDAALNDRLTRIIEVNYLAVADEAGVLVKRTGIDKDNATKLAELAAAIRSKAIGMGATLTKTISTRRLIEAAVDFQGLGVAGLHYNISNYFTAEGGENSERAQVLLMVQGKFGR